MTESVEAQGGSQEAIPCGQYNRFGNACPNGQWALYPDPNLYWYWNGLQWVSHPATLDTHTRLSEEDIDAIAIRVVRLLREKI